MLPLSIGEELVGSWRKTRATAKLQERVTRLFEEARDDVYRYLLTLGLHPPQAQEATQEVFLRLYSALRKGEEIRTPRGWIFRVAHNLGVDIRARQDAELPYDPELDFRHAGQLANPEQQLAERESTLRFHRAVEGLSEQQRRCLFLRLEGLRYAEIAAALGISPSAVGEFLRRAIERLRRARHE
ncbi:MAG TPA: RNA polymerase sigma factor [Bryobacteraceae bacterium]|jgi:RNA polymerase sigma-70 factor (ECF subfamily)|nr:RNA polymerase sigma factor [Bryobacteraceae bacterium]